MIALRTDPAMLEANDVQPVLLTRAALATMLMVSQATLDRLNHTGKLPRPLKLGACVRWRLDEIERWLAAGAPSRAAWERMKDEGRACA